MLTISLLDGITPVRLLTSLWLAHLLERQAAAGGSQQYDGFCILQM